MKAATEDLLKKRSGGGLKIANQSANGLTDETCHAKEYPADSRRLLNRSLELTTREEKEEQGRREI